MLVTLIRKLPTENLSYLQYLHVTVSMMRFCCYRRIIHTFLHRIYSLFYRGNIHVAIWPRFG